jgi:hypothetical protein
LSSTGTGGKIEGRGTNHDLTINTSGTGDITLIPGGNVGIGTTSPDYDLDVERTATTINNDPTIRVRNAWSGEGNNTGFSNRAEGLYSAGADTVITRIRSRFDTGANYGEVGTTTNHDFRFITNGGEKMRLTAAGNLGIGTTTPLAKLDIQGTQGQLFSVTDNLSGSIFAVSDISGVPIFDVNSSGVSYFDGDVGIGTTSPSGKLDVNVENGVSTVTISRGGSNLTAGTALGNIVFPADYNGTPTTYASIDAYANALSGVRGSLDFKVKSTGGSLLTGMTVYGTNSGANVGIGTTSPSTLLHIEGSSAGYLQTIKNTTAGGDYLQMLAETGDAVFQFESGGTGGEATLNMYRDGTQYVKISADAGVDNYFNNGANVGIGTTSPGSKLQVAGEIRAADGNKGTPSYTFTSDTNTGMYSDTANVIDFTAGGTKSLSVTTSGATVYGSALMPSNVAILLQNQNNNNQFYIRNSGVSDATFQVGQGAPGSNVRFFINGSGNVGIGNTASTASVKLEVTGNTLLKNSNGVGDLYLGNYATANHFRFHTNNANTYFDMNCGDIYWRQGTSTRYQFFPSTANMTVQGTITQNSDVRIKENVVEISDCISKVQAMRGVYYNRTDFNTEVTKVGVIAQEVEAVLPELVLDSPETGLKSVAYSELTSVLINAIKEQQEIIEDLKTRITKLEN